MGLVALAVVAGLWGLSQCFSQETWSAGFTAFLAALVFGNWLRTLPDRRPAGWEAGALAAIFGLLIWGLYAVPAKIQAPPELANVSWNLLLVFGLLVAANVFSKQSWLGWLGLAGVAAYSATVFFTLLPSFLWLRFGLVTLAIVGLFLLWRKPLGGSADPVIAGTRPSIKSGAPSIKPEWLLALALLAFILVLIRNAWVCDDAYITFRTVDNFLHGFGLRWNVVERVQTYTHPLWMMAMTLVAFFTRDVYYTSIVLGVAFSAGAVMILMAGVAGGIYSALAGVMLLTFSKGFVDFSTSGLENSLTYFLLAFFYWIYFRRPREQARTLGWLSMIMALALVNRMDTLLLFFPALAFAGWQAWQKQRVRALLALGLGFLPFVAWEIFSLIYYGFLFPNTAYAKLASGAPLKDLLDLGAAYFVHGLAWDPLTLIVTAAGLMLPFRLKKGEFYPVAVGIVLYLAYIYKIGGDFMGDRFLAAPMVAAVLLLVFSVRFSRNAFLLLAASLCVLSLVSPHQPWKSGASYNNLTMDQGFADERGYYYAVTGLLNTTPQSTFNLNNPSHPMVEWIELSRKARELHHPVLVHGAMGAIGYFAGSDIYVVDELALCDPLLARLPAIQAKVLRSGHFMRKIPAGYLDTLWKGENLLINPGLNHLYAKLQEITRGPCFSSSRWKSILEMNSGQYRDWVSRDYYAMSRPNWLPYEMDGKDEYEQLFLAGSSAFRRHSYDPARTLLEKAWALDPKRPEALLQMGAMDEHLGRINEALKEYQEAASRFGDTWSHFYSDLAADAEIESTSGGGL
jgi:arabinofuranosyltransferase